MKSRSGFTIIEIIVVITVIAILSSLALLTFERTRAESRDAARSTNATIISEALEKYYEQNGEYPSVASITNENAGNTGEAIATKLSVPIDSLIMPKMPGSTNNSITAGATPHDDYLAYEGESAENNESCQNDINGGCDKYTLRYIEEGSSETKTITSRRNSRSTGSAPEITVSAASTTSISASWTAIPGTTSYTLQRSLSADMSTPVVSSHTAASTTVTGLAPNTEYFFRVRAILPSGSSGWSEVESATTSTVPSPTGTITITAAMSGTNARGTAGGGTCSSGTIERQVRYQVNGGTWQGWVATSPRDVAATEGYTYTFQAQARCVAAGIGGPWVASTTASVTRPVTAPSGLTITAAMSSTNAVGTAGGGSCAAGTTIDRQIRYEATSTATAGTWTAYATGASRTVAAAQGYRYTFQQQARCVGSQASSAWVASGTAATVRPITTAPAPVLSSSASGSTVTWTWPAVSCPTGTTAQYRIRRVSTELSYDSGWGAATTSRSWAWGGTEGYLLTVQVQAQCTGTYSTGPWSSVASRNHISPVLPPAAPTNFTYYLNPARTYDSWTWTAPTCKSGQRAEFFENSYITGAGWYWVATGEEGWRYGTDGWSPRTNGPPTYGTWNESPYPWGNKVKVQHKAKYVCINTTTNRVSADGPVGISALVTVP